VKGITGKHDTLEQLGGFFPTTSVCQKVETQNLLDDTSIIPFLNATGPNSIQPNELLSFMPCWTTIMVCLTIAISRMGK
jgi:hypothetical protein